MPFITQTFQIQAPQKAFLWLMKTLNCSQKEAQKILDKRRLTQNSRPIHKSETLQGFVQLLHFVPTPLEIPKVVQTPYFVIYDKLPQLLTHPKGTFMHLSLCDTLKSEFGAHANPLHRLDYETSGLLICSIVKESESTLKTLFEKNQIQKTYLARVRGKISKPLVLDFPILTPPKSQKTTSLSIRSKISPQGKKATTLITPLSSDDSSTLVLAQPLTGRTHQIRLHLAHINHPILGDPLYGCLDSYAELYLQSPLTLEQRKQYFGALRLLLHAYALEFEFEKVKYHIYSPIDF